MKSGKLSTEHFFYGLAIILAVGLRFIGLGNTPLSDGEARIALQAVSAFQPGHVISGGQPGYVLLTAASFFLFGTSEFLARFWPAVLGSLLVLMPYLGRERFGQKPALVMAFALAFEPSLVAASRQADGRILAITGLAFAMMFLLRRNAIWAGILNRICGVWRTDGLECAAGDRSGLECISVDYCSTGCGNGARNVLLA